MLTQCPKCETIYRLGAADLGSAQGFVECGECGEQFNALERLADEPKFSPEQAQLVSDHGPTEPPAAAVSSPAIVLLDPDEASGILEPAAADAPADPVRAAIPAFDLEVVAEEIEQASLFEVSPVAAPAGKSTPVGEAGVGIAQPAAVGALESSPAQTLSESEHAILFTDPGADLDEGSADDAKSVDFDDVPAILQAEVAALNRPRRARVRWLWTWLAILFTAGLVLQFAWAFRDRMLAALPDTRPLYMAVCQRLGCRIDPPGATGSIELLARDVRDHPQYLNTLLVNATLVSRSQTANPFPIIELGLYGRSGEVIGIRRFEPREYLDKSIDLAAGMPPNRPVYVVMEVAGAGRRAVSFEFTFL